MAPLLSAFASLNQKENFNQVLNQLEVLFQNLEKDLNQALSDAISVELERKQAYESIKTQYSKFREQLVDEQNHLEQYIEIMQSCVQKEQEIIDQAAEKISHNKNALEHAANMCISFEKSFQSATQGRNEEIDILLKLEAFVLQQADVFGQYIGDDFQEIFLSRQDSNICKWTDLNNNVFDLSPLRKSDKYVVSDETSGLGSFELIYVLNICQPVKCKQQDAAVYEGLKVLDQIIEDCDIIAYQQNAIFSHIDNDPHKGVSLLFQGDTCALAPSIKYDENNNLVATQPKQSDQKKKAIINIECSTVEEPNFRIDSSDQCNLQFFIKSPYGCIGGASVLALLFAGYIFLGSYINKSKYGLTGSEAFPNFLFWQDFPYLVNDGVKFSIFQATAGLRIVKEKFGGYKDRGIQAGYNTI
ncbi:Ndc1 nucleoporin protein, putative [Ichthyophthirius multifiliis]|uniref:Autophagy-related protein 27 n=1 Tax=Ichthyophthirius multifiliis TaxID=5932 RepID=G0R5A4_ICHMU|nr:Ndc1 nucleoporin protein, putative [Ichthyophthirius multifiliis]EGR27349.1 Ndc1 nucleoporin protein, putative [Ichthyophthirius multifiliis]|eukprot:XP_004024233.1 Ndc1 nucleoporin protein, putative [Ichthyophthirius multifiliis]